VRRNDKNVGRYGRKNGECREEYSNEYGQKGDYGYHGNPHEEYANEYGKYGNTYGECGEEYGRHKNRYGRQI
jgi:hypothetical protein